MSDVLARLIGAAVGLLIVLLANFFLLPYVLRQQREKAGSGWTYPLSGKAMNVERMAKITKFSYRVTMPFLFAFVFGYAGVVVLGGQP